MIMIPGSRLLQWAFARILDALLYLARNAASTGPTPHTAASAHEQVQRGTHEHDTRIETDNYLFN